MRLRLLPRFGVVLAAGGLLGANALAYDLDGPTWPNGTITMQLQLGAANRALSDGATNWDDVAAAALDLWNPVLSRCQFAYVKNSTVPKQRANGFNNVFFDSTIYGDAFGDRVLAVTLLRSTVATTSRYIEADVIVNSAKTWDSYRGDLRSAIDLQRVVAHEFGHVLGLNHPDQANPAQRVVALMNSSVSNVYTPQSDDIAGVTALYGQAQTLPPPASIGTLANQSIAMGQPLTLTLTNTDAANTTYAWTFTRPGGFPVVLRDGDGNAISGTTYSLFSAQPSDAGQYSVAAVNGSTTSTAVTATVSVTPVSTADALLVNLSARGRAGSGNDTFIVGFVITGNVPKTVLVRGVGPGLLTQGVSNPLANPLLNLFRFAASGSTLVASNDDWSSDAATAAAIRTTSQRVGAFPLADGSNDAALLITLAPGVYTAQVNANGGNPGIALVEVYDADASHDASLQRPLVNVSTRSFAGTGEEQLFAGFVVGGNTPRQVLVRAVGPGLASQGVTGVNANPYLVLYHGQTQIASSDNWSSAKEADVLPGISSQLGAFALTPGSNDAALLITLPPGVYSAKVSGRNGETGIVLLEVYQTTL